MSRRRNDGASTGTHTNVPFGRRGWLEARSNVLADASGYHFKRLGRVRGHTRMSLLVAEDGLKRGQTSSLTRRVTISSDCGTNVGAIKKEITTVYPLRCHFTRCSLFVLVGCALVPAICLAQESKIHLFLMAGQSNMAGADSEVDGQIFTQTEADRQTRFAATAIPIDDKRIVPWGDIHGYTIKDRIVHGPEVGFARTLYAAGWRDIAIIKVFGNFKQDTTAWPWAEGQPYYRIWTQFVDDRIDELKKNGKSIEVSGFVWHQGIDDAIHRKLADSYQVNLSQLIAALRKRYASPNTPFVLARSVHSPIAQPTPDPDGTSPMARVRKAQVAVAESASFANWIDTDDLPNVNRHHFSAASQLIIGQRFAEALLRIH
jgi:Carbohydrate esterase, sialic acid-specific acetylesterase